MDESLFQLQNHLYHSIILLSLQNPYTAVYGKIQGKLAK